MHCYFYKNIYNEQKPFSMLKAAELADFLLTHRVVFQRREFGVIGELVKIIMVTPVVVQNFHLALCVSLHLQGGLRLPQCVVTSMGRVIGRTSVRC